MALHVRAIELSRVLGPVRPYKSAKSLFVMLPLALEAGTIEELLDAITVTHVVLPLAPVYHVGVRWHRIQLLIVVNGLG